MWTLMLALQDAAAPAVEAAAEATKDAAGSGFSLDGILKLVVPLIGLALTAFAIPYLRKLGKKANLEAGATLFDRVKGFVFRRVGDIIEENYPKIAAIVVKDGLDAEKIKGLLYELGAELKAEAIAYFKAQGVDLIKEMGDDALDKLIRSAANKLSPFPGKSTAVVLAETTISNMIVDKGVDWAAQKFMTND